MFQLTQLSANNNQLKEENNRLSIKGSPPRKCNHPSQIKDLETALKLKENEAAGLLHDNKKQRRALSQFCQILPGTNSPKELENAVRELQNTERNANNQAIALAASLEDWENVAKILCPDKPYPFEAAARAQEIIEALSAFHERPIMTDQGTSSGMFNGNLTPENVRTIWNQIPLEYRNLDPGAEPPSTSVELLEALRHVGTCRHPQQAALALGDTTMSQEWEASLEQMEALSEHQCPPPTQAPAPFAGESRLFKPADVPKFKDTKDYDNFRSSLLMFLQSWDAPAPTQFAQALLRILGTFEDPVAQAAAKGWDIRPLLNPASWEVTYRNFLQALDDKFQSATLLQDTKIEWMKCKPKPDERPADFFNRFEALCSNLQDVQERTNAPLLSDTVAVERLLLVLPRYLVDNARQIYGSSGRLIENETLHNLRKHFEISWTYLPRPAATGHNTKQQYQTGNARLAPAPREGNQERPRQCGLIVSYDTQPPVPREARGSLYPDPKNPAQNRENLDRRTFCAARQLCTYCRRPRSEHHPSGPNFRPVTAPNTRRTPQEWSPPSYQNEPLPESRQLTAPPPPSVQ